MNAGFIMHVDFGQILCIMNYKLLSKKKKIMVKINQTWWGVRSWGTEEEEEVVSLFGSYLGSKWQAQDWPQTNLFFQWL